MINFGLFKLLKVFRSSNILEVLVTLLVSKLDKSNNHILDALENIPEVSKTFFVSNFDTFTEVNTEQS